MIRTFAVAAMMFGATAAVSYGADAAAGKTLYGTKCRTCHGADYMGNPGMAKALKAEFKPLDGADIQKKTDADLKKIIMEGSGKMKGVTGLMPADVDNIVAFLRSIKK